MDQCTYLSVRRAAALLAAAACFLATQAASRPLAAAPPDSPAAAGKNTRDAALKRQQQAAEEAEDEHFRSLFGKFKAQTLDALATGGMADIAKLPDRINESVDGRLLYVRAIHIDEYAQVAGVDTPEKTTTLLDAPFSAWRVGIPKVRDAIDAKPLIARKTQDGRNYLVIQNGRLESGRYADDLSLLIAIGLKKPGEWPKGPPAVRQVIAMLELPWQEKLSEKSLDEAATSLKPAADEAVDEIMRAFNRRDQTFAYRHRAVQILQRLNTEKARTALLDVALGRSAEDLPSMKQWASAAYIRTTQDPANVRKLLASDDADVLGNAVRAIKGVKLDEPLLKRLIELTTYKGGKEPMSEECVRLAAAAVMASDPSGQYAAEKVAAILAAVEQVAKLPHAGKIHWPGSCTYAESSYQQYMRCLSEMPGADEALRQATARANAVSRDLLVIARAQRGDAAAHEDLLRILDDKQAGMRRAWAVRSLPAISTPTDVPLLKKLAASDGMERDQGGCVTPPGQKSTYFPVRDAAKAAIRQIETRPRSSP